METTMAWELLENFLFSAFTAFELRRFFEWKIQKLDVSEMQSYTYHVEQAIKMLKAKSSDIFKVLDYLKKERPSRLNEINKIEKAFIEYYE